MKKALFPGSFDPITSGHINLIERTLRVFHSLTILIAESTEKQALFTVEERVDMIRKACKNYQNISVDITYGLLMEYAHKKKADAIIRGLRATSDFEYEFQMAAMNKKLNPHVETFFMMTGENFYYVSSRAIKEVASHGGEIAGLVPKNVEKKLKEKFAHAYRRTGHTS